MLLYFIYIYVLQNDDIIAIIQHEEEYQDFVKNKNKMNCKNGISIDSFGKKNTSPKDLTSIIEKLIFRNENSKQCTNSGNLESPNKIHARLQPIPDTKIAMYQNIYCDKKVPRDFIKNEVYHSNISFSIYYITFTLNLNISLFRLQN